ncbi:MAG: winged helix-turn-helix domain-containing protein, partial [Candidatus Bathyarchaeota archaeon]
MGKYRDKLQIIAEILSIASEGARKTRIMYKANLSYSLLCRYLADVMDSGLLGCSDGELYVVTPKGREFLNMYGEYSNHCRQLAEHLDNVNDEKGRLEQMCTNAGG